MFACGGLKNTPKKFRLRRAEHPKALKSIDFRYLLGAEGAPKKITLLRPSPRVKNHSLKSRTTPSVSLALSPKFAQISDYGVLLLVTFFRALINLGVLLLFFKNLQ